MGICCYKKERTTRTEFLFAKDTSKFQQRGDTARGISTRCHRGDDGHRIIVAGDNNQFIFQGWVAAFKETTNILPNTLFPSNRAGETRIKFLTRGFRLPFPFTEHGEELVSIFLRNPEAGDIGGNRQKFVLSLAADSSFRLDEEDRFRAKHCRVNPFGTGIEVDECNTSLRNKDAGFISRDKLPFFIDLSIVVVINAICCIAGTLVYEIITVVVDAVRVPLQNLSQWGNLTVFVNLSVFIVVNAILRLLEVTVKNVISNATNTDTETVSEVIQRIIRLDFVPEASDIFAVEPGEFTTAAVKDGGGQATSRNKERIAFDQNQFTRFVNFTIIIVVAAIGCLVTEVLVMRVS